MNQEFRVSRLAQVKRVLVLHDLGADADNAAWRAGMLARRHGGWLRVLHLSRFGNAEEARTRLAPLAWRLQEHLQIAVLAQAVRGPFTEELRRAAEEADLIVISPPSALAAATGSHPLRVARLAGRPTLVVRTSATTPYRRVLVGEGADRGLDHGRAVAHSLSDGKEVPVLASLGSAGELLDRERALFPDLVVLPCPQTVSIARRFLAHTRADTLLVPVSRATARARPAPASALPAT